MKYKITKKLRTKYTEFQLNKLRDHSPNIQQCPECGVSFDAKSYLFRPTAIYERVNEFCSPHCKKHGAGKKNKKVFKDYVCEGCGNSFTPHKSKPHQKFCNHQCYSNSLKNKPNPNIHKWIHKIVPPRNSVSNAEVEWLKQFNITHTQYLININQKSYRVDGFDSSTNTIYEYLGSFWHGNPAIYDPEDVNPVCKVSFGDLHQKTIDRLRLFEEVGYNVVFDWSPR